MDAKLHTQSDLNGLRMLDIEQFSDDSGGVCNLDVQSSPFQAQIKFFFDNPSLLKFIDQLKNLENSLSGKARLGNMYEDPYIQFEGNGRGHVTVSGKLQVSGDHSQQLEFEFRTDQTALGPFIHELETARLAAPR